MIKGTIEAWLNKDSKPTTKENVFIPKKKLLIERTVFPNWSKKHPNGTPIFSPNGTGLWFGLIEGVKRSKA